MSSSQGQSARILAFPAILTEPVQQQARPGRLPRSVASLRAYRRDRAIDRQIAAQVRQQAAAYVEQATRLIAAAGALEEWLEARR